MIDAFLQHSRDIDPEAAKKNYKKYQDSGRDTMYLSGPFQTPTGREMTVCTTVIWLNMKRILQLLRSKMSLFTVPKRLNIGQDWGNGKPRTIRRIQIGRCMVYPQLEGNRHAFERMGPTHRRLLGFLEDPVIDKLWDEMADSLRSLNGLMDEWQASTHQSKARAH